MKANNLLVLKALLDEVLVCFEAEGKGFKVIGRSDGEVKQSLSLPHTYELQLKFGKLRTELYTAENFSDVSKIVQEARILSVKGNFYFPREYILLYERLVAIKTLDDENALAREDWCLWRSAEYALARYKKWRPSSRKLAPS